MHSWFQYCVDPDVYDKCRTLKDFIAVLRKQSNTDEALIPYRESVRFDDYDEDGDFIGKLKAPRYFGAGFEAFSEVFLNVFDNDYNLTEVHSQDGVDIDIEDTGYEGYNPTASFSNRNNFYHPHLYNDDTASTPNMHVVRYFIDAVDTTEKTFSLIAASYLAGFDFSLNSARTINDDFDHERGVSNITIKELYQV